MKNTMKKIGLLFSIVLVIMMFAFSASALEPTGQCGDNVYWNFDESSGELVISGEGKMWDYGYYYTDPGHLYYDASPFYRSNIKSVIFKDFVTSIGDHSFENCFELEFLTIGLNIKSVGDVAFRGCTDLTNVELVEGITSIGDSAFSDCTHLKSMNIPKSITYLGDGFLDNTALINYKSDGLIVIDDWIYGYKGVNQNTTVYLTKNIKGIVSNAFSGIEHIISFDVPEENKYFSDESGVLFNKNKTSLIQYPRSKSEVDYIVPNTVENISNYAFFYCDHLENVIISNNVKNIGDNAFSKCYELKSLIIGDGVDTIGKYAFYDCRDLENIKIGKGIKKIESQAFRGGYFRNVYIDDLIAWCSIDFADFASNPLCCNQNGNLYLNDSILQYLILPEEIDKIKPYSFSSCGSIKCVTINNTIKNI